MLTVFVRASAQSIRPEHPPRASAQSPDTGGGATSSGVAARCLWPAALLQEGHLHLMLPHIGQMKEWLLENNRGETLGAITTQNHQLIITSEDPVSRADGVDRLLTCWRSGWCEE
ncbi:hypothetical protein EYF80_066014 [Liparis tanakae]|uniref:Uncharacterized protein n=1 Tax=Liparis tanakae TaxID=230148 RepID=A0A4Z2E5H8_9TELE|nr:hypothetical protein EYF80_066014 [Liparis tanakae]